MKYIILIFYFNIISIVVGNPQVTINLGTLRGAIRVTENQNEFAAFTGIPYAKPPIKELRFKPISPPIPWEGILDATKSHERCLQPQSHWNNYTVVGSEDCLYLNVYTPKIKPESQLAVMVFIHGGAFVTGSAMDYDPSLLMNHDIVLVTINYRLGPMGFLTSGSAEVLGNEGLKDQVRAIKWVKRNIHAFGGDSNRITLFGQGAGGISAHYHMVSPMSKNLISGVIAQSGTAIALNALMPYFLSVRYSNFLAERLDCPINTEIEDMMKCMTAKDGENLIKAAFTLKEWDIEPITLFKPVMEPDHKDAFISADPIDIILSGEAADVPFMTGLTANEGDFRTNQLFKEPKLVEDFNKNFKDRISLVLNYKEVATPKLQKSATKEIMGFYFKNKKLNETRKKVFSQAYMDAVYLSSANSASDLHSKHSKSFVYFYVFGYKGLESYCNLPEDHDNGVCHSDDLLYLFNNNFEKTSSDHKVAELMTKLWTNFAKYGNPTPNADLHLAKWEPYNIHQRKCYLIKDSANVKIVSDCYKQRSEFWRNLELNERTAALIQDRSTSRKDEL